MLGEGGNKSKLQTPSSLCSAMERAGAVGQMLSWERAFGDMIQGQAVSVVLEHSRIWYALTEMHHSCPLSAELLLGDKGKAACKPRSLKKFKPRELLEGLGAS